MKPMLTDIAYAVFVTVLYILLRDCFLSLPCTVLLYCTDHSSQRLPQKLPISIGKTAGKRRVPNAKRLLARSEGTMGG